MIDDPMTYVVPGQEIDPAPTPSQSAYWHILCPCGRVHDRTVTIHWREAEDGFAPGVVEKHCFVCVPQGIHYCISKHPPFEIVKSHEYRPQPQPISDDDDYIPF